MKKRLVQATVLAVLGLLVLAGCSFAPMKILGTWSMATGYGTEYLEFKLTKFTLTAVGSTQGTWECSIEEVDQNAGTILMKTTDTTGDLVGISTDGELSYWYYEISGDALWVGYSFAGYPSTTAYGPYYK